MAFRHIQNEEERLRFSAILYDSIADAVIGTDNRENEYRIISWNKAAEKLYGWKADEVIGRTTQEVLPTNMTPAQRQQMLEEFERNGHWTGEVIHKTKNGHIIHIQANVSSVKNKEGEIIGAVAVNRDITERIHAEEKLKLSEEKYRQLSESLDDKIRLRTNQLDDLNKILQEKNSTLANTQSYLQQLIDSSIEYVLVLDRDLHFILVNKRYEEAIGINRDDLIGKTILQINPKAAGTLQMDYISKALEGETLYLKKMRAVSRPDIYVDTYFVPLVIQNKFEGVIVMSRDITTIVEAEQELENRNRQLNDAQQIARTGSWDWNIITGQLSWSDNMYKVYGLDPSEPISFEKFSACIHPDERENVLKGIQEALAGGPFKDFYHRIITPAGETRILYARGETIFDNEGKLVRMLGTGQDVTEQIHQVEEIKKLVEFDVQKSNFIAMASHELKTPLTSIKGYVQLLLDALEKEKKEEKTLPPLLLKSSLKSVEKQVNRLTRIISELLDLSKIETGTLDLRKEKFLLNQLAIETVEDILYTNSTHQINIFHDAEQLVEADKDRINQVMINFLTNAIKYSPQSNKINVRIHRDLPDHVTFSVEDFGIGIDVDEQKRVFERFYRAKGKEEQTYPGFGIGLFIANEFIQKHGGHLNVKSEKGKGSVFSFTIPINTPAP